MHGSIAPVLLVEDDEVHVRILRRVLAAAGLANPLLAVADGAQAIELVASLADPGPDAGGDPQRDPPTAVPVLVLLDLNLPGRGGLDVLAALRARPALAQVPVVVLTASTDDADIDAVDRLGAHTYLVKPVGFDALLDVVRGLGLRWALLPPAEAPAADGPGGDR